MTHIPDEMIHRITS